MGGVIDGGVLLYLISYGVEEPLPDHLSVSCMTQGSGCGSPNGPYNTGLN
jgi:hypothetical protein